MRRTGYSDPHTKRSVLLTDEQWSQLYRIGQGNYAAGIRKLISASRNPGGYFVRQPRENLTA